MAGRQRWNATADRAATLANLRATLGESPEYELSPEEVRSFFGLGLAYLVVDTLFEAMGHYAVRRRYVEVFLDTDGGKLTYPGNYYGIMELFEKIKAVDASTVLIRENDLRHVDEKLDAMQAIMLRAEGKIDQHVRDHATGAMSGA